LTHEVRHAPVEVSACVRTWFAVWVRDKILSRGVMRRAVRGEGIPLQARLHGRGRSSLLRLIGGLRRLLSLIALAAAVLATAAPSPAQAFPVSINPGGFQGGWEVGGTPGSSGPGTVDLAAGSYFLLIGETWIPFDVGPTGSVSTTAAGTATAAGTTITLLNSAVMIDPGAFQGGYSISRVTDWASGPQTVQLVPGTSYTVWVGEGSLDFDVASNGQVTTTATGAATATGSTLHLLTTSVTVDPGAFQGIFSVSNVTDWVSGRITLALVPGISYLIWLGEGLLDFDVATNGQVTTGATGTATASGNTVTFLTSVVAIDPGAFRGIYDISRVMDWTSGAQNVTLVPGLTYSLELGEGNFDFDLGTSGQVTTTATGIATATGNTLRFLTSVVAIAPGAFQGIYDISRVMDWTSGAQNVTLVPGLTYSLELGEGNFDFDLATNGQVTTTATGIATATGNTLTFLTSGVVINPGAFQGSYAISRVVDWSTGPLTVALVPGFQYSVWVGEGNFDFDLGTNGVVTTTATGIATATGNTLTFLTSGVMINPGAFQGSYAISRVADWGTGPLTVPLVPGIGYSVWVGEDGFDFDLGTNGLVTTTATATATTAGSTLTFLTSAVTIDPATFLGSYAVSRVQDWVTGPLSLPLVPAISYSVWVGEAALTFQVNANGTVSTASISSFLPQGSTLSFLTRGIEFDPGGPATWAIGRVVGGLGGVQLEPLVPGTSYSLSVAGGTYPFSVAPDCAVTPGSFDIGGDTFTLRCPSLATTDAGLPDAGVTDGGPSPDAGVQDAGATDAGPMLDAGVRDGGTTDAGPSLDAGSVDAGATVDAGLGDGGVTPSDQHPPRADLGLGCGCSNASGFAPLWVLALLVVCRRRGTRANGPAR
jgi:hypothetical protein